uniref:Putative uncharacterized protein LOC100129027 n=1 Tax=Homo sapiens TaxID=9606 RepID=YK026_HUMAN|nr:RecName: Full=Putative uncharacterized protein LOC100129027 [Homo sapiens]CAH10550.1 hypothetical protein [Homo sapiens]
MYWQNWTHNGRLWGAGVHLYLSRKQCALKNTSLSKFQTSHICKGSALQPQQASPGASSFLTCPELGVMYLKLVLGQMVQAVRRDSGLQPFGSLFLLITQKRAVLTPFLTKTWHSLRALVYRVWSLEESRYLQREKGLVDSFGVLWEE